MAMDRPDFTREVTQIEVLKKDLQYKDREVEHLEQELRMASSRLKERDARLGEVLEAMNNLEVNLAVKDQEVAYKDQIIAREHAEFSRWKSNLRLRDLIRIFLSVVATVVIAIGVNIVTSSHPDVRGYILIALGAFLTIIAVFMSIYVDRQMPDFKQARKSGVDAVNLVDIEHLRDIESEESKRVQHLVREIIGEGKQYKQVSIAVSSDESGRDSQAIIRMRVNEEPLTPRNLSIILSALTSLYTKCWLIQQGRFPDLFEYTITQDTHFEEEAQLTIIKVTFNSPIIIDLLANIANPRSLAESFKVGIDAIIALFEKRKDYALKSKLLDSDIEIKKKGAQSVFDDRIQDRYIVAGEAHIKFQSDLIELEKKRLDLKRQEFKFELQRLDAIYEIAFKMVDKLYPQANADQKAIAARSFIKNLLELSDSKGIELLAPPQDDKKENDDEGS